MCDVLPQPIDIALDALMRVRELHKPTPSGQWCVHCYELDEDSDLEWSAWPCATIKALEGKL